MEHPPTIVWFRLDLRLDDQLALAEAARRGPVLPLFILPGDEDSIWQPGIAGRWWLQESLRNLDAELRRRGSQLRLRRGPQHKALREISTASGSREIFATRRYEPAEAKSDTQLQQNLSQEGITLSFHDSPLLFDPAMVLNQEGSAYRVFTPFWNRCLQLPAPAAPIPAPGRLTPPQKWPDSIPMDLLAEKGRNRTAIDLSDYWQPGAYAAAASLDHFLQDPLRSYINDRDHPDLAATSRLSPYLHFGEISSRRVWFAVREHVHSIPANTVGDWAKPGEAFLRQIIWREFAHHILYHFPRTPDEPSRSEFTRFPWRKDARALEAWQQGRTGYPLVDAGMRQLLETGWMHNRVRMVTASFLTKHLLISWKEGAHWFWDRLVDADLANNTFGWQWAAGCGHDAAPYFRIFNPVLQGEKFDPQGDYVRRWVPELASLPPKWIHQPWRAPASVLQAAKIKMGRDYPLPFVDHAYGRARALSALRHIQEQKQQGLFS